MGIFNMLFTMFKYPCLVDDIYCKCKECKQNKTNNGTCENCSTCNGGDKVKRTCSGIQL